MIDTYLINLDRSPDRLAIMTKDLSREGIAFERIPAVDGAALSPDQLSIVDNASSKTKLGRNLSNGEIGCFLSHIAVAKRILAGPSETALVLEDDAIVPQNAVEFISMLVNGINDNLGGNWALVNLAHPAQKFYIDVFNLQAHEKTFSLNRANYFPVLTTALLWSKDGAAEFLKSVEKIHLPVDVHLQNFCCKNGLGLALVPAPFKPRGLESVISGSNSTQSMASRHTSIRSFSRKWENYTFAIKHFAKEKFRNT